MSRKKELFMLIMNGESPHEKEKKELMAKLDEKRYVKLDKNQINTKKKGLRSRSR